MGSQKTWPHSTSFLENNVHGGYLDMLLLKARGFSLIEVLIALLVLSVGLLGLAALQTTGLRYGHSAYLRSQTTMLAYDMADRMRANLVGVRAGLYDNLSGTPTSHTDCKDSGANCSAAVKAQFDLFEWNTANAALLPSGQGTVRRNGTSPVFTITVMWDDNRLGATGTHCNPSNPNDLKCFAVSFQP
jgi:type IV pilus assembly protein PilV